MHPAACARSAETGTAWPRRGPGGAGSLQKIGNQIRIVAELVQSASGVQIWSADYDSQPEDIFSIQDKIASDLVRALEVAQEDRLGLMDGYPPALAAYEALTAGRLAMAKGTVDGLDEAVRQLKRALEIDPGYAAAHVNRAEAYALQDTYTYGSSDSYSGIPSPRVRALQRPLIDTALELDPLSAIVRYNQAKAVWSVGRAERAVAAEPGYTYSVNQLIFAYQLAADFEQAPSFFKTVYPDIHAGRKVTNALTTWPTLTVAAGACGLHRQQLCERQLKMAEQGLADHRLILGGGFLIGTEQMQIHAIRGERAATIAEFRRIVDAGRRFLWTFIQYEPAFATYLDDPEFAGILAEVEAASTGTRRAARWSGAPAPPRGSSRWRRY